MRVRCLLGAALTTAALSIPSGLQAEQAAGAAAPARTITITVTDPVGPKMSFSARQIVAKPGERLRIEIVSTGKLPKIAMAHNWVLLALGSDAKKFADAAAAARATDYIPMALKSQVVAHTGLVGPGEKSEVTFTVPKAPGAYPYVCSFAGHFGAGMAGNLLVK
jgi:azurin